MGGPRSVADTGAVVTISEEEGRQGSSGGRHPENLHLVGDPAGFPLPLGTLTLFLSIFVFFLYVF